MYSLINTFIFLLSPRRVARGGELS